MYVLFCDYYHPRMQIGNNFPQVCLFVQAITLELPKLGTSFQYVDTH